jgi:hypothetical protein
MSETETDDEDLSAPPRKRISPLQSSVNSGLENGDTTDDLEEISREEYRSSAKRKRGSLSPALTEAATEAASEKPSIRKPLEGIVMVFLLTQA